MNNQRQNVRTKKQIAFLQSQTERVKRLRIGIIVSSIISLIGNVLPIVAAYFVLFSVTGSPTPQGNTMRTIATIILVIWLLTTIVSSTVAMILSSKCSKIAREIQIVAPEYRYKNPIIYYISLAIAIIVLVCIVLKLVSGIRF